MYLLIPFHIVRMKQTIWNNILMPEPQGKNDYFWKISKDRSNEKNH